MRSLAALAGFALLVPLASPAQEPEGFTLKLDPVELGVIEVDADTDSAKFEEYRDTSSGFFVPRLRLRGGNAAGRSLSFRADRLLRDDARYTLEYGVAGRWSLLVDYNKIPHNYMNDARLLWNRTGPGRYELADPIQATLQGALEEQFNAAPPGINFTFLNDLITPYLETASVVDVGLRRDRTRARLAAGNRDLTWTVEVAHENRDGTRPYGAAFGFNNVTELPEPIRYASTDATVGGEWNTARGGLSFGARYSTFENDVSTLVWDNPWRATSSTDPSAYQAPGAASIAGSALGFADLAPDNRMGTVFAFGRFRLPGNWYAGGSLTYGRMQQDDPLLPYTLNEAITGLGFDEAPFDPTDPANLPRRNADNEADVLSLNADAGTRFGRNVSLAFRARYYDYDNRSARISFPGYVRYHGVWEEIGRITVPYAYSSQDLSAELGWDLAASVNLSLAYTLRSWDRDFRETRSSDEDIVRLGADWRPAGPFSVRVGYEWGDRTIDEYIVEAQEYSFIHPEGVNNIPTLRKYLQAEREYGAWNVLGQLAIGEAWTVSLGATGRDEDYPDSLHGLVEDDIMQYSVDLAYAPGAAWAVYAFGHLAERDTFQRARQSGATPSAREIDDWYADFDEETVTAGLGLTRAIAPRWTLDVLGRYSRSDGFADFTAFPGGLPLAAPARGLPDREAAQDIPNYEDFELLTARLKIDYALARNVRLAAWYMYEDYTADSFITQGLRNYLPGAILLAGEYGDYTANLIAFTLAFTL